MKPIEPKQEFIGIIKAGLEKSRMTRSELAKMTGVELPTLAVMFSWFDGKFPTEYTIRTVANALDLDQQTFMRLMALANRMPYELRSIFIEYPEKVSEMLEIVKGMTIKELEQASKGQRYK